MISVSQGISLKKLDLQLSKCGDLYSFEGPFLSHFIDETGRDYLMNWVDIDSEKNRWLLFSVTVDGLARYLSQGISLRDLILNTESGAVYFIDIDNNAEYKNVSINSVSDIPDEYLPKADSFFDPIHSDEYAVALIKINKDKLRLNSNSFMNKVVSKLFISGTAIDIELLSSRIIGFREPNFIDETAIVQSLLFPLIIHYHSSQNEDIKELIINHSSAFSGPSIFRSYVDKVHMAIFNEKLSAEKSFDLFFEEMINSTAIIVRSEPRMYGPLYNYWLDTIKGEYKGIDDLYQVVKTKRRVLHSSKKKK